MRDLMTPRNPPETPNFFEIDLGEIVEVFKLPNFAARQELIQLYASAAGAGDESADLLRAMSATLGACWWGRQKALDVDYFEHRKDLVRFGDLVLTELEDAGLDVASIVKAGGECVSKVAASIPGEQEVKEKEALSKAEVGA